MVCGLLVWFVIGHREIFFHRATPSSDSMLAGKTLARLSDYAWDSHPTTLVLGLRQDCHFCQASMPFYKRLSDAEHSGRLHAHMLTVMPDAADSAAVYLHSNGLDTQHLFGHPLGDINVLGTPTLMLVNSRGMVTQAWVGQLTQSQEKDVTNALEQ